MENAAVCSEKIWQKASHSPQLYYIVHIAYTLRPIQQLKAWIFPWRINSPGRRFFFQLVGYQSRDDSNLGPLSLRRLISLPFVWTLRTSRAANFLIYFVILWPWLGFNLRPAFQTIALALIALLPPFLSCSRATLPLYCDSSLHSMSCQLICLRSDAVVSFFPLWPTNLLPAALKLQ